MLEKTERTSFVILKQKQVKTFFQEEKTNLCMGECEPSCPIHSASTVSINGVIETNL
jgi:hypothetical protein